MVVDPSKPTRDQLERVAQGDYRLLRALERLFEVAGEETPDSIEELRSVSDAALALAAAEVARVPTPKTTAADVLPYAFARSSDPLADRLRGPLRGNFRIISDKLDLPAAVGGVINLADDTAYWIAGDLDLEGDYLLCGRNTSLAGGSSENSSIKSTGLSASVALIHSEWSVTIRDIALDGISGGKLLDLDAAGNAGQALDWRNVNFLNTDNIGEVANYGNFVGETIGILGAAGWVFSGTVGTIAFANTLFAGTATGTIITVPAAAVIERRFRVIYSAVVVPTGGSGFDVSVSASIPVEGYIFDFCNFAGGGTYLVGLDYTDNKARFLENRGITNTAVVSGYYMQGNTTTTVISATNTPVKAAGTTAPISVSQKFDTSITQRAGYEGAIPRNIECDVKMSLSDGNNNTLNVYVAKNGSVLNESKISVTTSAGGRVEGISLQVVTPMVDTDYLEVWVENTTSTSNILVEDLNVIVKEVG